MASKKPDRKKAVPMIRFGGEWIPAHDLWNKMETANVVTDVIERFNERFPHLSSSETRDVVPLVRQRLKDIDLRMPDESQPQDLTPVAIELLNKLPPEDVVKVLHEKHNCEMDINQLIRLAGEDAYASALEREAGVHATNKISLEQTAELWNEAARPAPGGGLWSAKKVQELLDRRQAG